MCFFPHFYYLINHFVTSYIYLMSPLRRYEPHIGNPVELCSPKRKTAGGGGGGVQTRCNMIYVNWSRMVTNGEI